MERHMAQPPTSRVPGPFRPTRLGQWEVIAKIAGGGMSAVYLGRRVEPAPSIPNVVALKIARHDVAQDPRLVQMFLDEGKLIARLDHPNIVRTLEVGADTDHDFIAMELMLGKPMSAVQDAIVNRGVRLNAEIAAWVAARIADALHHAHELPDERGQPLGLIHRDVNPANVFATFDGQVKLFDFGLAKSTSSDRSGRQLLAGKLSYLSPEQIMQLPLDRRSDVFSLGTTLWELLTGRRLFRRESDSDTVRAVQLGPIPDIRSIAPEVPEAVIKIAKTALERNREHRYPSAAALARELDAFVLSRASAQDLCGRIAQLVDTLFPEEQKRQSGWLKPAISGGSRSMKAVSADAFGVPASIPPSSGRGQTSPMPSSMRPPVPASQKPPPPLPQSRPPQGLTPPRPSSMRPPAPPAPSSAPESKPSSDPNLRRR